uniref:Uncharacterized protein n=1 Tax=Amphiprion percula TaxID=161767 RepID=A0A3P8SXE8_AMPPE
MRFYDPCEQMMGLLGFLRVWVWMNGLRAFKNDFLGNILGERFVLGGVFVIRQEEQGILLEHREIIWVGGVSAAGKESELRRRAMFLK